ncbi:MAG: cytochrome c maturation protein CcmE, partial [Sphingopyxis sp.]|nr:cytochrome c maturation protein CcmE [Sphingopyxis sp.]
GGVGAWAAECGVGWCAWVAGVRFCRPADEIDAGPSVGGEPKGLVRVGDAGSIKRQANGLTIDFIATDGKASIPVEFTGIVPDLFAENSGMVADGRMRADGTFVADRILAKHDERYMPPQMGDMPKNMKVAPKV